MSEAPRLRHVPRVHAGWVAQDDSDLEHATAPLGDVILCGRSDGQVVRHLFEDVSRARSCRTCQALSDAIQASDLLRAVAGASRRGDLDLPDTSPTTLWKIADELAHGYPDDPTEPNFDVEYD